MHIKGATTPFYLAMSESFHPQWQAQFSNPHIGFRRSDLLSVDGTPNDKPRVTSLFNLRSWSPFVEPDRIRDDHHFELNGFLNGWYIDINEHCIEKKLCTQNPDGSYDIELTLEFFPQRWFYLGLLISGTTLLSCIGYLGYDFVKRRKIRHTKETM